MFPAWRRRGPEWRVQFVVFLGRAIDLDCPQFPSALFSAKGTLLR